MNFELLQDLIISCSMPASLRVIALSAEFFVFKLVECYSEKNPYENNSFKK